MPAVRTPGMDPFVDFIDEVKGDRKKFFCPESHSIAEAMGAAERENGITTEYKFVCTNEAVTYYPDGDMKKGEFRKRGEPYEVVAKPPNGPRSQWVKIVPGRPK